MSEQLPPVEVPTVEVKPNGAMVGRTIRMGYPSVRLWIAQQRGEISREVMYQAILDAIEEHDLGRDPAALPPTMIVDIGEAWMAAIKEAALPPASGDD